MLKTIYCRAGSFASCPIDQGVIDPAKVYISSIFIVKEVYVIPNIVFQETK